MKLIAFLVVALCAAQAFAVSWDQADPVSGWKGSLPRAQAVPAAKRSAAVSLPSAPPVPPSVIAHALKTFKDFSSTPWAQSATITAKLPQYFVGLTDLASLQGGQDPRAIMKFDGEALLVEAGGRPRAVIMLSYYDKPFNYGGVHQSAGWHEASIEGPAVAQAIDAALGPQRGVADTDAYLIFVPALHEARFLAVRSVWQTSAGNAYSLWNEPSLGLKPGVSTPVARLFSAMKPLAQKELSVTHDAPGA